ncbi:MAG: PAS domain-containing hybrid sensor histidine kinase/response regulator [Thermodesulfobacteriota bacterium]
MKKKRVRTLSRELIVGLTVIVSVSTLLVTAVHIWLHYMDARRDLSAKSKEYSRFLQKSLSQPIWNFDFETVEKIAKAFSKNDLVAAVRVADEENNFIYESGTRQSVYSDHHRTTLPIAWGNRTIGRVDFWLTRESLRSAVLDMLWGSLAILAATLAAIIGVTRFFVTRHFRRPLQDLMARMDDLASGKPSTATPPFRHQETLEILNKFDEMKKHIHQREKDLENLNTHLENEIQERKQTALSLRKSEQHWHDIIQFASVGIYQTGVDGRILLVNPKLAEVFGYGSPEELSESVSSFADLYADPEDRTRLLQKNRSEGPVTGAEIRFKHTSGRDIWCHLSCRMTELNGEPVYEGFLMDMTERKQAENALRTSERRLAQIIDFLPDPTFVIDVDSRVIAWNRAIEALTDVPAETMLGKGDFEYAIPFYKERRPILIDLVRSWNEETAARYLYVKRKGHVLVSETEDPPFKPDDSCFWNAACLLFDENGAITGAIETIRDISEAKRVERSLRESKYRFKTFFNSNPDGVAIIGFDGAILDVNKSLLQMTGYAKEALIDGDFKNFIPSEYHPEIQASFGHFGKGLAPNHSLEVEYVTREGRRIPANVRAWLMTDRESRPMGIGVFLKDLSQIKHLSSEKADLEKQLQQSQKLEAIGTLAGGIAHDFNNIMAGILGYSELIQIKYTENFPELSDYIDRILKAGNRARDIVRHILQYSREENGLCAPVDIAPLVRESIQLLESTLPAHVQVIENLTTHEERVSADPARIHQVIMNLCTNAGHSLKKRGGNIIVSLEKIDLNEPRQANGLKIPAGPYLQLTVSDTGDGIAPDIIDRIFDPYFTTKSVDEGTGLGLSVTLGIVKNLKGLIEVESIVNVGTAFTVFLPEVQEHAFSPTNRMDDISQGGQEHILIIDDEPYFLEAVKEHLTLLGYRVTAEGSSLRALDSFRTASKDFDLILTDQSMPEMTGIQLAGLIRELNPAVPIILCTGFSDQVTPQSAGQFGISRFLMKPVSRATLAQAVFELLQQQKRNTALF